MGRPKWEVAGNEMGGRIYHVTWDFQAGHGTSKMGSGRYNEMGRRIYHRRWDAQDGKWQIMRWEDAFTTGDGTSKMGSRR